MDKQFDAIIRKAQEFPLTKSGLNELYKELAEMFSLAKNIEDSSYAGLLITFDGHSGAGKDTQIELLQKKIEKIKKIKVSALSLKRCNVFHLAIKYYWQNKTSFPGQEVAFALNACGRRNTIYTHLIPLLREGVVIMNRSVFSPAAYRAKNAEEAEMLLRITEEWDPVPDIAFILECDTDRAFERIKRRAPQKGNIIYENETPAFINRSKRVFAGLAKDKSYCRVIDANGEREEVSNEIWIQTERMLNKWKPLF